MKSHNSWCFFKGFSFNGGVVKIKLDLKFLTVGLSIICYHFLKIIHLEMSVLFFVKNCQTIYNLVKE